MRTPALVVGLVVVGVVGCQPRPAGTQGEGALTAPAGTISVTPAMRTPSLEEAQKAQGTVAARALSQKTGIPVEAVAGAAPEWWPVSGTASGLGRGQAVTLEAAYQAAVRQARGSSTGGLGVARAGWARLPVGDYVAWVQAGSAATAVVPSVAARPAPAAPVTPVTTPPAAVETKPVVVAPAPVPVVPAPTAPAAPEAPPAAAASEVPAWFTTAAKEVDGRVQIGATADAPTVQEAPRMAIEAARAALGQAIGTSVTELRPELTYVTKANGKYRAYVLVSSPGTIKK